MVEKLHTKRSDKNYQEAVPNARDGLFLMQPIEVSGGEVEQGGKFQIGGTPFGEGVLIRNGNDDALHAGRLGSDHPVE